jgi:hypothetical protein
MARQKPDRQPSLLVFAALMLEVSVPKKHSPFHAEVDMIRLCLQDATLQPNTCARQAITTNIPAYTCLCPLSTAYSATFMVLVEG